MSSIRVNPYPLPDLLEALSQVQQQQDTATLQLSTGNKINQPSDDPIGAAQLVQIAAQTAQADSYEQSIGNITGQLSTADSTLNSVVTTLQQVISLGTEGANGTLSATDRAAIVNELTQIQSQLISLANTSYQGQYLFAGTAGVAPYVADGSSSSGVTYKGNTDVNQVTIGNGYSVQINLPGSQIFNGTGADVFQSVNDLITALNNDTGIGAAVNEVSTAYNYLSTQQVFYGNALDQAQSQQTYLDSAKTQLAQQQNTVAGADEAALATQVTSDATAENATLSAIAKLPQNTLFDYLQ